MGYLTFPLYYALKQHRARIVTTLHELPEARPKKLKARVAYPYLRTCLKAIANGSDAIVVHSKADQDLLVKWDLSLNSHLIPHGIVQQPISSSARPTRNHEPKIGFLGFLKQPKGVHRLIEALAQLEGVQLVVGGAPQTDADDSYCSELRARVRQLGIADRVKFVGFVPNSDLADFFQSVDLVAFPYSQCTASGALHLALAHGCVTLTSNLPVFQELKARFGCLETFDLTEPSTLVTQLQKLLTDEIIRSALIRGTQRIVTAANWEQVAKSTYALYLHLLSGQGGRVSL
jgi:glycosyltransferase involved in cell wall biosynthesis